MMIEEQKEIFRMLGKVDPLPRMVTIEHSVFLKRINLDVPSKDFLYCQNILSISISQPECNKDL
jgi:hypothetical protein